MERWEYKVILPRLEVDVSRLRAHQAKSKPEVMSMRDVLDKYGPEFDSIAEVLNKYGQEGWELVAIETTSYHEMEEQPVAYLKRRIEQ
jgi:hypothetical protein